MVEAKKTVEVSQVKEILKISSKSLDQTADSSVLGMMQSLTSQENDGLPVRLKSKSGSLVPYFINVND